MGTIKCSGRSVRVRDGAEANHEGAMPHPRQTCESLHTFLAPSPSSPRMDALFLFSPYEHRGMHVSLENLSLATLGPPRTRAWHTATSSTGPTLPVVSKSLQARMAR